ncbi:MAG TPA: HDIG domain-containing protein [Chloroflexota bacterium]
MTLFGVATFLGLLTIVTGQFAPSRYHLTAGDVSPVTVKSPQKVVYSSQIRTREERARAAAEVAELYVFDLASVEAQRQKLNDITRQIGEARRTPGSLEARREPLTRLPNVKLRPSVIDDLLTFSDGEWQAVAADAQRVVDVLMRNRITERQLEEIRTTLPAYVGIGLNDRQGPAVVALVGPLLKANFVLDPDGTERARREAQDRVEAVRVTIEKGETIVRDGDVVRPFDIERLEAVGLRNPTIEWRSIAASALLIGLLVSALVLYIHHFRPRLADQPRSLLLVGLILLLTVLAVKLIVPGRDLWAYVLPLAAPAMLIALLLGADLAIVLNIVLAACFGLIGSNAFELSFIALIGGLAGVIVVWRFERLNTFFLAGLVIAVANFAASAAFALMAGEVEPPRLAILGGLAAFNGMLSAALTLGTLAIFGHLFGITTTLGLLELAHPTQPLFRRLLTEAPGTYHHSVVIANLAERAAEAIGADPMLCRVGAYYHDIGKIVRPYAFIENQLAEENIHDRLDPATSARMIGAHVTDGLELARRYRLPDRVRDMIAQHHGTRLIGAFYQRALAQSGGAVIDQAAFKYSGPRPQTREAGILMLADGVEATLRAVHDQTAEGIERTIRKVVEERLTEGQLDECDLTFRDLERIRQVFFNILRGMFHPRITYPDYAGAPPPADGPVAPEPVALERG